MILKKRLSIKFEKSQNYAHQIVDVCAKYNKKIFCSNYLTNNKKLYMQQSRVCEKKKF